MLKPLELIITAVPFPILVTVLCYIISTSFPGKDGQLKYNSEKQHEVSKPAEGNLLPDSEHAARTTELSSRYDRLYKGIKKQSSNVERDSNHITLLEHT